MKNYYSTLLLLAGVLFFSACSTDDPGPEKPIASPSTLVSVEPIVTWSPGDIKGFLSGTPVGTFIDLDASQYSVEVSKITYMADYQGDSIEASAMLMVPIADKPVPTISFQHGTIASDAEAPTNLAQTNVQIVLLNLLATTGVTVVVPDFIGFGSSVDVMHPYYVEDLTATSIVNAIYASRKVAEEAEAELNNELYLAGYSQGGYATMTAHKYYEVSGMDFYELQASFPSSGGYDIKSFQEYFWGLETYDNPFFLAFVANAYKVTYDWEQSLGIMFQEPYATNIPSYFDGSKSGGQINDLLTTTIADLLQADILANVDDEQYSFLVDALVDNSPIDFVPQIPMHMFHGDADVTVPYQNSLEVYDHFIANGASAEVVTFTTLEGGTHYTGFAPYVFTLYTELQTLKE